jgi:hypothetical protein
LTDVINITPNFAYRVSFWGRGTCRIVCNVRSLTGDDLVFGSPRSLRDDSIWVQREFIINVEVEAIRLLFGCAGSSPPDPLPILRLDAVSVVPTTDCPIPVRL